MNADEPLPPILVADDNPTDVFFLQRRLAAARIDNPVEHVEDGVEAVRWLEQRLPQAAGTPQPWLVFVDLRMQRMDGFELLRWLQSRGCTRQLTVAVLTTSDEPADIDRAKRLGAHRYLVKYPRPADLVQLVAHAKRRAIETTPEPVTGLSSARPL